MLRDERYPHLKRNYALGFINGVFMAFAYSFADPNTVLPVFVVTLTGSNILAGIMSGLFEAGWNLPQMFVSRLVEHREQKLPLYRSSAFLRAGSWAAAAAAIFLIGDTNTLLLFAFFFVCYLSVCVGAGIAAVPFMDVVAKSIPPARRGSFFAYRRLVGGIMGVGAGVVVARVLGEKSGLAFPYNYGVLICFTTALAVIGLAAFSLVKEPRESAAPRRVNMREHMRNQRRILREDANYRLFYVQRVLAAFGFMALPFFAVFAVRELGARPAQVGLMVSLWMVSSMASNLWWGALSDRHGSRALVVGAAALSGAGPILALATGMMPARVVELPPPASVFTGGAQGAIDLRLLIFFLCFVLNGVAFPARKVGNHVYLLDISPARLRPTYIGLMNTLSAPLALAPALGGVLTRLFSYQAVFALSLVSSLLSLLVALRLSSPGELRDRDRQVITRET